MDKNKKDLNLEKRPNAAAKDGSALRWVKKVSAEDLTRAKQTGFALSSFNSDNFEQNDDYPDIFSSMGPPPQGVEARTLYRRHATVSAIGRCKNLTTEERLLMAMRYGLDGRAYTIDEVAEQKGISRLEVRQGESVVFRKVLDEFPALEALYERSWLEGEK